MAGALGLAALVVVTPACAQAPEPMLGTGPVTGTTLEPTLEPTDVPDLADAVSNALGDADAEEALDLARAALAEASSYRVSGSPAEGQVIDLVFVTGTSQRAGESPRPIGVPPAAPATRGVLGEVTQDGSTFSLLVADGDVYVRGDLDWLADAVDEGARRTLGRKWLLVPESLATGLEAVGDPESFADSLLHPAGPVRSVGVSLIDDTPAVGIRWVDSEATAWLAGVGPPYPILVERLGATADEGVLRFSDIGEPVTLAAPDDDDVVVAPEPTDE